jgi:hypothetical protein
MKLANYSILWIALLYLIYIETKDETNKCLAGKSFLTKTFKNKLKLILWAPALLAATYLTSFIYKALYSPMYLMGRYEIKPGIRRLYSFCRLIASYKDLLVTAIRPSRDDKVRYSSLYKPALNVKNSYNRFFD